MSLRTKINGFTAWVNLRLTPYNQLLNNVLMDLLSGTHMKYFVESFTGRDLRRLENMDGLTDQQKQTRVDWVVEELKKCNVLPEDVFVDSRLFAMRSADHVFDMLWRLISHDIWFVWERAEYLQVDDLDVLTQVPFKWTPDPPPRKKKSKTKAKKSLLSGFGASSVVEAEKTPEDTKNRCFDIWEDWDDDEKWIKFPNSEYMKGFKKKKLDPSEYPTAEDCILEMVNYQLKNTRDGKGLHCYSIDDFADSRVLCAIVNSFVPNTFTADLLLNDRWTINLALKTAEKMFYAETPFEAEDLVEADNQAVCAYFAFFFMVAYRYRQTTAVVNRVDFINMLIRETNHELEKFPAIISNMSELQRRKDLKSQLEKHRLAIENLQKKFDVDFCRKWVQHVDHVQNELRREIRDKMRARFEIVEVPRNISINDLCLAAVINLSLTNGSGFYLSTSKETIGEGRKIVLRRKETGEYIEDFTYRSKLSVHQALRLPDVPGQVLELNTEDYPEFEFYFEAPSRNKQLRSGSFFLYQVFPGNTVTWQRLFIKSAREAEYETVEKMIAFFREDSTFVNCKEPKTGHTALHWASRMGHFEVVRLLLENGAGLDVKNNFLCTPVNLAIEALQRRVCHLLVEWGCNVHSKNVRGQSVLETIKNEDFKRYLMDLYEHYSDIVPRIMNGDMKLLDQVIADHAAGLREFCCLRSRCINGSTLLHTACYYGHMPAIKDLLSLRVDVNIRDYKGATPLHRAKDPDVMEILLEAGANVNAEDSESNTPLHVKCYGETNKPSELDCIQMLLNKSASLVIRNSRGLLPIHCCVMQGRIDVMQLLLKHDKNNSMATALGKENDKRPPSLIHLAIANDFPECAEWLISNSFQFKDKEQDILMRRILTEQIKLTKRGEVLKFLLDHGAEPSPKYPGGNTALHYAAGLSGPSDVLELLVSYGAEIDIVNEDGCTPLFFATQSNNKFAACVLISQGANVRQKNSLGLTAFDYIVDFEEWIECGYFTEEIKARLKAYNLKHARDLIRAISKRVKPPQVLMRPELTRSAYNLQSSSMSTRYRTGSSMSGKSMLPPVTGQVAQKYLMY
ncbi:uncharacterized protein LOC127872130 isoform X2 [Dreissena polymorpha]|uniref:Calponin-homology (CH) domain-containing protein n=1 Tax=Dreissena polymorpha TaxID=45954 RepID=A0A9D4ML50_DREPO|nr:uncharacterized protein LOC127872130 isoform X2 [Dreissena polymorpha]XP_052271443.1 uncharacterized protein LOC127872130 isoform X2 [Dreissena polymorpha]XP_052271450.1 uncharacterized protein LOC127872130 isoform X2 [Dreissena polymorpha]KAH3877689.1 hypothetical protein DPMN_001565 [Dreissena polymorpha]